MTMAAVDRADLADDLIRLCHRLLPRIETRLHFLESKENFLLRPEILMNHIPL